MKTLSAAAETAITSTVREWRTLVEISFTTPLRYSSGDNITWNSLSWVARPFDISAITTTTGGVGSIRLTLFNRDNALTSQFLSVNPRGKAVTVWALYGAGPWVLADGIELFSGVLDGVLEIGDSVVIEAAATRSGVLQVPSISVAHVTGLQRLPQPGDKFYWGGSMTSIDEWELKEQQ